jgi:DNA-binding Lrp family transcriptional regulator
MGLTPARPVITGRRRAAKRDDDRALQPACCRLVKAMRFCWIAVAAIGETRVIPFFIQIKCKLGKSYAVANALADAEIASEIYSTAGDYDLLVKFYVEPGTDIGHFVNEKVQTIPGIEDTRTIITFKAF